ncbi:hypothetical protein BJ508DRAFT_334161 [Ascobolus immersus RN42]|uniref:Uncharacterized protein n=1 Tax=Ascobolus immersus RN42 TaxID=1160509 RepID=A0A3N4HMM7_ASCIM|nr:hypothetical protein BJ508DRAFT_334161 [Ascobolus immersus RN42]
MALYPRNSAAGLYGVIPRAWNNENPCTGDTPRKCYRDIAFGTAHAEKEPNLKPAFWYRIGNNQTLNARRAAANRRLGPDDRIQAPVSLIEGIILGRWTNYPRTKRAVDGVIMDDWMDVGWVLCMPWTRNTELERIREDWRSLTGTEWEEEDVNDGNQDDGDQN